MILAGIVFQFQRQVESVLLRLARRVLQGRRRSGSEKTNQGNARKQLFQGAPEDFSIVE